MYVVTGLWRRKKYSEINQAVHISFFVKKKKTVAKNCQEQLYLYENEQISTQENEYLDTWRTRTAPGRLSAQYQN